VSAEILTVRAVSIRDWHKERRMRQVYQANPRIQLVHSRAGGIIVEQHSIARRSHLANPEATS
jgi:hypothetical protein